jgi:mannose-6-phosphate isomerase
VQQYAWGQVGSASAVARLSGEAIDETKPYAELWMGTHPSGPSVVVDEAKPLGTLLEQHPEWLGNVPSYKGGGGLPFLFKVLSVGKSLSIQAHPDKRLAEKLHAERPAVYKDDNHKPEIAIALTPFQGLCGFRSPESIVQNMDKYPEFAIILGDEAGTALREVYDDEGARSALRTMVQAVLTCPAERSSKALEDLQARLAAQSKPNALEQCILTVLADFPGDVGAVAPLFLHLVHLSPGEAFFMAANEPHAYLKGDIIECMACSDNVVRAGLTPKLVDVPVLVEMLTYDYSYPTIMRPSQGESTLYKPPVKDFEVEVFVVEAEDAWKSAPSLSPQILLVIEGTADGIEPGACYFVPANDSLELVASSKMKIAIARAQSSSLHQRGYLGFRQPDTPKASIETKSPSGASRKPLNVSIEVEEL